MKVNYVGVIGGILAFISLALPWWTLTFSSSVMGFTISADVSIYPYRGAISFMGFTMDIPINLWFGLASLAFIIIGGILGIVGSITQAKGKAALIIGGFLALLSIIVFAAGLQSEFSKGTSIPSPVPGESPLEIPAVGLFSNGTWNLMGTSLNYTSYLSFGFWLALVAAILMLAGVKKVEEAAPTPAPVTLPVPPPPP
ncbi:MAG: hypothetical protein QXK26_00075 [Candidatus Bathyarchaeia archaeon]